MKQGDQYNVPGKVGKGRRGVITFIAGVERFNKTCPNGK